MQVNFFFFDETYLIEVPDYIYIDIYIFFQLRESLRHFYKNVGGDIYTLRNDRKYSKKLMPLQKKKKKKNTNTK